MRVKQATFIVTLSESTRAADVVVTYEIERATTRSFTATAADDDYEAPIEHDVDDRVRKFERDDRDPDEHGQRAGRTREADRYAAVGVLDRRTGDSSARRQAEITINNATGFGIGVKRDGDPVGKSDSVQVPSTLRRSATAAETRGAANVDLAVNADTCNYPCMIEGTVTGSQATEVLTVFLTTDTKPPKPVEIEEGHSVVIPYATTDGTATGDVDYKVLSGTLTFTSTAMEHSLTLETIPDALLEDDETFTFTIHTAELPDMQQTVGYMAAIRIQDDDTLVAANSGPTVTLSSPGSFPASGRFTVNIVFSDERDWVRPGRTSG